MSLDYFNRSRGFRMQPAIPLSDIHGRNTVRMRVKRTATHGYDYMYIFRTFARYLENGVKIRFISRPTRGRRYKTVVVKNSTIPRDENIYEHIFS